jgi:hypothetical protein
MPATNQPLKTYALTDSSYQEVSANWGKTLESLGIQNYSILCVDKRSYSYLKDFGLQAELREDLLHPTYNSFMANKLNAYRYLLGKKNSFIFSDVDAIPLIDPRPFLGKLLKDSNFIFSTGNMQTSFSSPFGFSLCSGWFAVKEGRQAEELLNKLMQITTHEDDQYCLNELLFSPSLKIKSETSTRTLIKNNSLSISALSREIITRGKRTPNCWVVHPFSQKTASSTIHFLKRNKVWILDNQ